MKAYSVFHGNVGREVTGIEIDGKIYPAEEIKQVFSARTGSLPSIPAVDVREALDVEAIHRIILETEPANDDPDVWTRRMAKALATRLATLSLPSVGVAEAVEPVADLIERLAKAADYLAEFKNRSSIEETFLAFARASAASLSQLSTKLENAERERGTFAELYAKEGHTSMLLREERDELRAKLAEAREALEPFAEFAEMVAKEHPGWDHDDFEFVGPGYTIKFAPFRRARASVKGAGQS